MSLSSLTGTTPEQLFSAAWSTSFLRALQAAADQMEVRLPMDLALDGTVRLDGSGRAPALSIVLLLHMPRTRRSLASELVEAAMLRCPLNGTSLASVEVRVSLVEPDLRSI